MFCEICGEWAIGNTLCHLCEPIFSDFEKFPFSTATIQIQFTSTFFKTENPPDVRQGVKKKPFTQKVKREIIDKAQKARKQELVKLFSLVEKYAKQQHCSVKFKSDATRATSSLLQKRNRQLKLTAKDSFYNSAMIKKTYTSEMTHGAEFKTSCGLFFNSARITLGMWTHRKQVASEYIRLIRSVLGPHRFKMTGMKTIFVNVAFKFLPCCLQPLPPLSMPLPSELLCVDKSVTNNLVVFNLSQVFEVIRDEYEKTSHLHTLSYAPLLTNQNKIHVCVVGRGGGSLSLYRTGTVMQLGFSKLQTIVEEFQFLARMLEEKFNFPKNNQLELYKRKKLEMGGQSYQPHRYPKFLM
jgi:hypothetical protein